MSSLTYINEPGAGQSHSDACHYSQATNDGALDPHDTKGQVDLAFENVDRVLRACGLRGWEDVYSVRSYHVDMDASYQFVVEKLKARIPGHRPIWTAVGVPKLAFPEMVIEIEVEAWRGEE